MADPVPGVRHLEAIREDAVGTLAAGVDLATGERVAVRRLHARLEQDEGARLLFAEEARRIATLDAALLLRTLRSDARAALPWIVTEPVDGETLEDAVRAGPFSAIEARRLAVGLLKAFAHLEGRRQFHAAPVPRRIVRVGDAWRLLTFRDIRADDEAPRMKGRPVPDDRFAPPELSAGEPGTPKGRTLGVWAAAALWTYVRTGRPPDAARLPADDPDAAAVERMLEREPIRRPASASDALALVGVVPSPPTPAPGRGAARPPR